MSETSYSKLVQSTASLTNEIFNLCRNGLLEQLETLLNTVKTSLPLNERVTFRPTDLLLLFTTHSLTSLIIASQNGHANIIEFLLKNYRSQIDVEKEGTINFDILSSEDYNLTALWIATTGNHFECVRLLVELGNANVNYCTTNTKVSVLQAATQTGNLEMIKYLKEKGGSLEVQNSDGFTPLMVASLCGYKEIVQYLLSSNEDSLVTLNLQEKDGRSALHFAVISDQLEIVKLINESKYVDKQLKDKEGFTALVTAAVTGNDLIFDYFIEQHNADGRSLVQIIEELELAGSSCGVIGKNEDQEEADDDDDRSDDSDGMISNSEKVYRCFLYAMKLRFTSVAADETIEKVNLRSIPIDIYENRRECKTVDELEAIIGDKNALRLECLLVLERLLGELSIEHIDALYKQSNVYAEQKKFRRCLQMCMYARRLEERRKEPSQSYSQRLLYIAVIMSTIVQRPANTMEELESNDYLELFNAVIGELKKNQADEGRVQMELETFQAAMSLIWIATKLLPFKSKDEQESILQIIRKLNRYNFQSTVDKSSFLHFSLCGESFVDLFDETIQLLLQCGASPNLFDFNGNTPLHYLAAFSPDSENCNLYKVRTILDELVKAGGHMDYRNTAGKIPAECSLNKNVQDLFRRQQQLCLKCLCARVIKGRKVSYDGVAVNGGSTLSKDLKRFIELH
ncbi:unnamed protein product [Rotaria sp. Silwood1]|nr:unnamed protein product [Rotaria sp. Silwood1]